MKGKSFVAFALPLAMSLAFAAYAPVSAAAGTPKTAIVVGADTTFPPFETEKDGKVTGFDIDLIREIAKAEGLTTSIKTMPFNGLIPSLQAAACRCW